MFFLFHILFIFFFPSYPCISLNLLLSSPTFNFPRTKHLLLKEDFSPKSTFFSGNRNQPIVTDTFTSKNMSARSTSQHFSLSQKTLPKNPPRRQPRETPVVPNQEIRIVEKARRFVGDPGDTAGQNASGAHRPRSGVSMAGFWGGERSPPTPQWKTAVTS